MSDQFIGLTMLVTLKSPPGAMVQGTVTTIEVGRSLTLSDVIWPANGWQQPIYTIQVNEITDLKEVHLEPPSQPPPPVPMPPSASSFQDPAILSMARPPAAPARPTMSSSDNILNNPALSQLGSVLQRQGSQQSTGSKLVEPFTTLDLNRLVEPLQSDVDPAVADEKLPTKKKNRRSRKQGRKNGEDKDGLGSNGWRQTPLLEPNTSFQPFTILKKKGGHQRYDSGWATEDATDVQEMGDFDFAGSLAKFDKKTVFKQIRAEDLTADEDRLVAHNRLPRPGTNGGKNLHYTENVLDVPNGSIRGNESRAGWNSEADDTDNDSQRDTGSGRNSRRARSKLRGQVSRKSSAVAAVPPLARAAKSTSATFVLPSGRKCESISALQMINLENIANTELGLTDDMMAENAGRGIAEVALAAFGKSKVHQLRKPIQVAVPTATVFAGNNKSGVRAIAAARHLRNHGVTVLVCVLGLERESELLDELRRQMKAFRSFGGRVMNKVELMDHLATLTEPVQLVIDGLLGLTISFEELRTGDQATAYELIEWANRSDARVLAIDVPSGLDPSTGAIAVIDGRPLYLLPDLVVAMGAPKRGLLGAMNLGLGVATSGASGDADARAGGWQVFVADIGLPQSAWRKASTRQRRGVEFDGTWVMEMRCQ